MNFKVLQKTEFRGVVYQPGDKLVGPQSLRSVYFNGKPMFEEIRARKKDSKKKKDDTDKEG